MNLRWLISLALCGVMLCALASTASADWFGSSKKPAANGVTTTGSKKSWLPSWPGSKPKAKSSNKSSMLGSMAKSTKSTWNKTTSFLNPFDNPPKPSDTSSNSAGWFSSNKPEKTKQEVSSVPDYIGSPRPKW